VLDDDDRVALVDQLVLPPCLAAAVPAWILGSRFARPRMTKRGGPRVPCSSSR
jgi:hypothetical protein